MELERNATFYVNSLSTEPIDVGFTWKLRSGEGVELNACPADIATGANAKTPSLYEMPWNVPPVSLSAGELFHTTRVCIEQVPTLNTLSGELLREAEGQNRSMKLGEMLGTQEE